MYFIVSNMLVDLEVVEIGVDRWNIGLNRWNYGNL
jgi:hypothetical protein